MALCRSRGTQEIIETLTSPSLPFDLITEILTRLPVKLLLQLRCVCKSWNSLISDHNFAKKHCSLSTTHSLHCLNYYRYTRYILSSYSLNSVFTNVTTTDIARLEFSEDHNVHFMGSCNGILCLAEHCRGSIMVQLWNPSIRKFKELPSLQKQQRRTMTMSGFGYDLVSNNYKVVSVFKVHENYGTFPNHEVEVHTLGTNSWKNIPVFPYVVNSVQRSGQLVNGTINWLVYKDILKSQSFIISLDLGNESFEEFSTPDYGEGDANTLELSVFRDSLCLISGKDVWVMKEYGNKESWTKLFTISFLGNYPWSHIPYVKAIHIFEDDLVLLHYSYGSVQCESILCNCKTGTSLGYGSAEYVCLESLVSPYSIS